MDIQHGLWSYVPAQWPVQIDFSVHGLDIEYLCLDAFCMTYENQYQTAVNEEFNEWGNQTRSQMPPKM